MAPSFAEIPGLRPTAYGESLYRRGRELVTRGLGLEHLVWDADEVLWDWALSGVRLLSQMPLALFGRLGHREYVAIRPGMLELLWGMRHAALELGRDPHVRIWTSGYPWRLWRILREIEGFDELLGPPSSLAHPDAGVLGEHPRVFTRPDYVAVVRDLLDPVERERRLGTLAEPARSAIARQLAARPDDSGYKIPELALLSGKRAFEHARVLIDDARNNVEWFKAAGRSAVHVRSRTPRIAFGRIPNSAWSPTRFLARSGHGVALAIADALAVLTASIDQRPTIAEAHLSEPDDGPPNRIIAIDVPNAVLWREWINPMRDLRRAMKRHALVRRG